MEVLGITNYIESNSGLIIQQRLPTPPPVLNMKIILKKLTQKKKKNWACLHNNLRNRTEIISLR